MPFEGTDYERPRDRARLTTQHIDVRTAALAWPGEWFTMQALAAEVHHPPGSVERQVRYLRDPKFGAYEVEKRHREGGTFEYRVKEPEQFDHDLFGNRIEL